MARYVTRPVARSLRRDSVLTGRARILVITPDFPPAKGGIQILTQRIVASFERLDPTVVTLGHPQARARSESTNLLAAALSGQTGSQRHPSLSSHLIASPSPATPVTPWSSSRQYSPGS